MNTFSAAASLGLPIVLSQSGQDSIYLHLKKTFLEFYTTEDKEFKKSACMRSHSADCLKSRGAATVSDSSTRSHSPSNEIPSFNSGWEAGMNTSTSHRSFSPWGATKPHASENRSTSASTAYSIEPQSPAQIRTPRSGTSWDLSTVANIPSFVPQPMVFMQPWPQCMDAQENESNAQAAKSPALTKKQLQKKDLSKLSENVEPSQITTVMVRGIPCSFSRGRVLELLDSVGLAGKFDFFYLPCAGKSSSNLGYAFVNFVDSESVSICTAALDGVALDPKRSVKLCTITPADIQGLENLRKHFRRTAVNRSTRGPMFLQVHTNETETETKTETVEESPSA